VNILLHICCAPCAIYPLELLRKEGHKAAGYFYNPNIHPCSEYLKRKVEVDKWAKEAGLNVICGDYDLKQFFEDVDYSGSKEERCLGCWWMRLESSGKFAKDNGFDAFTTTLLGSPYQDRAAIVNIGEDIAKRCGIKFLAPDFAAGFRKAHDEARSKGIYCQNYCGCVFSEKERIDEKASKASGDASGGRTITLSVKGSKKKIKCSI
jgi:predicted adenine nucleotide alpha hydrolase (AANH) superfamily ATPase